VFFFVGFHYILLLVDLWDNYLYVEPLKRKTAKETLWALKKIIKTNHLDTISGIGCDEGSEFVVRNKLFAAAPRDN